MLILRYRQVLGLLHWSRYVSRGCSSAQAIADPSSAGPGLASGIPAMQEELGISHFLGSLAFGAYPLGFGVGVGLISFVAQSSANALPAFGIGTS